MDDLISRLSEIRSQYNCFNGNEEPYYRALSEVIKMLLEQADGDTISRQAAIDAMIEDKIQTKFYITPAAERDFEVFNDACDRHANLLKELPSAQPERCEDCENFSKTQLLIPQPEKHTEERTETYACDYISILSELRSQYNCFDEDDQPYYHALSEAIKVLSVQPDSGDAISRQAAIDEFPEDALPWDTFDGYVAPHFVRKILEQLPSAQPRNREWIDYSDDGYVECPYCHSATNCEGNKDELHYCFSCGADMRGEKDAAD